MNEYGGGGFRETRLLSGNETGGVTSDRIYRIEEEHTRRVWELSKLRRKNRLHREEEEEEDDDDDDDDDDDEAVEVRRVGERGRKEDGG